MTVAVMPDHTPNGDGSGGGERRQASAKPATEYKVFVGGISWHMGDKELKQSKKQSCQCAPPSGAASLLESRSIGSFV
jgi:hypothetical protein